MDLILDSIEHAVSAGVLYPAISTALTIPDIAGAVESVGESSQARYVNWYERFFLSAHPEYAKHGVDGVAVYALRCKLLHEGSTSPAAAPAAAKSPAAARKRMIAFNIGAGLHMHLCTVTSGAGETFTILRADRFATEVTAAARAWLKTKAEAPAALAALAAIVDVRTEIAGVIAGVPVICAAV